MVAPDTDRYTHLAEAVCDSERLDGSVPLADGRVILPLADGRVILLLADGRVIPRRLGLRALTLFCCERDHLSLLHAAEAHEPS